MFFFGGNILAGGGVRRNNDYSNKTQMAMSKMPPSQPAGTPGPGVRSHYSDRSPVSQGGSRRDDENCKTSKES